MRKLNFHYGEEEIGLEAEADGDGWQIRLPDASRARITGTRMDDHTLEISIAADTAGDPGDGAPALSRALRFPLLRSRRGIEIAYGGRTFVFETARPGPKPGRKGSPASGSLAAPMPGVVTEVFVAEGQKVTAYQPLVSLEAMKVLTTLEAPFDGVVSRLHVARGDRVELGALVAEVAPTIGAEPEGSA